MEIVKNHLLVEMVLRVNEFFSCVLPLIRLFKIFFYKIKISYLCTPSDNIIFIIILRLGLIYFSEKSLFYEKSNLDAASAAFSIKCLFTHY